MQFNNLSREQLVEILNTLSNIIDGDYNELKKARIEFRRKTMLSNRDDLENLIGSIPFLLTNKRIFERNQDIVNFAKKLRIEIPSPEKKKREDLIGRVVSAIAEFDKRKVSELNKVIRVIKRSELNQGKSNFFKEWENLIKQMNF